MKGLKMPMFKNKALYVQMVNPNHSTHHQAVTQSAPEPTEIPPWIDQTIKEYGLLALKGALVLMVAQTALTTVSQIIVNNTKPRKERD